MRIRILGLLLLTAAAAVAYSKPSVPQSGIWPPPSCQPGTKCPPVIQK